MNMTLRWYGPGYDSVTLEQIRQIPGVKGVITTLMGKMPGEVWEEAEIAELKKTVEDAGCEIVQFSDDDLAVLRDKAQVVYDMVKEDLGDDVVQGFLDAVDAARK